MCRVLSLRLPAVPVAVVVFSVELIDSMLDTMFWSLVMFWRCAEAEGRGGGRRGRRASRLRVGRRERTQAPVPRHLGRPQVQAQVLAHSSILALLIPHSFSNSALQHSTYNLQNIMFT